MVANAAGIIYLIDPTGGTCRTNDRPMANAMIAVGYQECTVAEYQKMQARLRNEELKRSRRRAQQVRR